MVNSELHVVYPKDETTDFLQEIIDYIIDNTDLYPIVYRLETTDEHNDFLTTAQILIPPSSPILYMGHGMSTTLSGATTEENSYGTFIKKEELSIFKGRKVILLTCRSNSYLNDYFDICGLKAGIGFPNLITDDYELYYPEEPDRVNGITGDDIVIFRQNLVDIIKYSLEDFFNKDLSFYQLYTRIQLRSQRALINFYNSQPNKGILPLGKMLYDLDKGLRLFGN